VDAHHVPLTRGRIEMTTHTWLWRAGTAALVLAALVVLPAIAAAQTDFSGEWAASRDEDNEDRGPGPDLGDYTGLPINDAARQKAEAWDASVLSLPERQAQPHPAQYFMHGPRPNPRIEKVLDPVTGNLLAYTLAGTFGRADRTIWLDGRAHPSRYGTRSTPGRASRRASGRATRWSSPPRTSSTASCGAMASRRAPRRR